MGHIKNVQEVNTVT